MSAVPRVPQRWFLVCCRCPWPLGLRGRPWQTTLAHEMLGERGGGEEREENPETKWELCVCTIGAGAVLSFPLLLVVRPPPETRSWQSVSNCCATISASLLAMPSSVPFLHGLYIYIYIYLHIAAASCMHEEKVSLCLWSYGKNMKRSSGSTNT